MSYSAEEKETVCVFNYIEGMWEIYSCVPSHMTRLRKISEPFWEEKEGERVIAAKWKLKGKQVSFAMERVSNMTPEQKEAAKARLQKAREKRREIV